VIRNDGHSNNDALIFPFVHCDKYKYNKNNSIINPDSKPGVKNQVLYVVKFIMYDQKKLKIEFYETQ